MRLWHCDLLPYLPDAQFKGQLRELVAIMHDWRDKGATNHILINKVMEYPKNDLVRYFLCYEAIYHRRYGKRLSRQAFEFVWFDDTPLTERSNGLFVGWHDEKYLKVCMMNLFEKYYFGRGKSKITFDEWMVLLDGYKKITGENFTV